MKENDFCWRCGRETDFEGDVEGVQRTVCCDPCCRSWVLPPQPVRIYAGSHRIPDRRAVGKFDCVEDELATLSYLALKCPAVSGPQQRFFLAAEIKCLAARRNRSKWKKHFRRRKTEAQIALGLRLEKVDPTMRAYLFDDYMCRWKEPTTSLEDVRRRLAVLHSAQQIRKTCGKAHPCAAFDFCLAYPNAEPRDFDELKGKIRKALHLEGDRIMRHLSGTERDALLATPLRDCVEAFEGRDKKSIIRSHLEKWVSKEEAQEIANHPACQLRIQREDDERRTAKRLMRFWRSKHYPDRRYAQLQAETGVAIMDRTPRCGLVKRMYVDGELDVDAREIAGVIKISSKDHFPLSLRHRCERISISVARFEHSLHRRGIPYGDALFDAILWGQRVPLPDLENVRDTFDYMQHTHGFWSERWHKP